MHSLTKSHSSAQQHQIKEQSVDLVTFSDLMECEIPPNTTVVSEDELESAFIQINKCHTLLCRKGGSETQQT